MDSLFSPNKTSGRLLADFAAQAWGESEQGEEARKRHLLVYDLYIKARSYAIINKVTFWLAVAFGIAVLVWPSVAIVTKDLGVEAQVLESAIVQTTVTGLAALTFAVYSHYKKRQMQMENLMRHAVYSDEPVAILVERTLQEMERIDAGFSFSEAVGKKQE